ncbi:MAG: DUF3892 domain-containing protein [Anaerolineae bacterium]|nr:DUF3892 domain-containing protein [Anaerolineae bacterium]
MSSYRIVCTEQKPTTHPNNHAHIVAVGTGVDASKATQRRTLEEVLTSLDQGHTFYTKGEQSGKIAQVQKYVCSQCKKTHIRSTSDAVSDNNLDNLRRCAWKR